jgi:hypothetical protein
MGILDTGLGIELGETGDGIEGIGRRDGCDNINKQKAAFRAILLSLCFS